MRLSLDVHMFPRRAAVNRLINGVQGKFGPMIEQKDLGPVTVLTIENGPMNVMDTALLRQTTEVLTRLTTESTNSLVVTGAGRAFSAGVDLRGLLDGGPDYVADFLPALSEALLAAFTFPRPMVAAVNGHAIAGGAVLAACADARLMADGGGRIGTPELLVGVPFPRVALDVLAHAVGPRVAHRLVFGADTVEPAQALAFGLADEVVPPDALLDRAIEVATRLGSAIPPDSFAYTKAQLRRETVERIVEYRPLEDPRALELWSARVRDGWTARYLERVTKKS
jgi:enoyl-CoA hydratase